MFYNLPFNFDVEFIQFAIAILGICGVLGLYGASLFIVGKVQNKSFSNQKRMLRIGNGIVIYTFVLLTALHFLKLSFWQWKDDVSIPVILEKNIWLTGESSQQPRGFLCKGTPVYPLTFEDRYHIDFKDPLTYKIYVYVTDHHMFHNMGRTEVSEAIKSSAFDSLLVGTTNNIILKD